MSQEHATNSQWLNPSLTPVISILLVWSIILILGRVLGVLIVNLTNLPSLTTQVTFQSVGILILFIVLKKQYLGISFQSKYAEKELSEPLPEDNDAPPFYYPELDPDKNKIWWTLTRWFILMGVLLLVGIIISLTFGGGNQSTTYDNLIQSRTDIYILLISVAVLAPILEETLFRKIAIDQFHRFGFSSTTALFLSSLFFATSHTLADLLYSSPTFVVSHLISTFMLGTILGYVYIKTRNVKYSMLLHGVNNLFAFMQLFISQEAGSNTTIISAYNIVLILFVIISVLTFLIQTIRNRKIWFAALRRGIRHIFTVTLRTRTGLLTLTLGLLGLVIVPYLASIAGLAMVNAGDYLLSQLISASSYLITLGLAVYWFRKRPETQFP